MSDYATRRRMMVDTQVRPSDVTKFPIIDAMLSVPREDYVPAAKREAAYMDGNIDLGDGRVLLEARSFAKLLDAVVIDADDVVLDVGCGLGYSTAVLAHMAAVVVGIEQSSDAAEAAQSNLSENGVDNAAVVDGPLVDGAAQQGPFDVIFINGAVEVFPQSLTDQLKEGGRVACIMMEGALGRAMVGHKIDGAINWRFAFNATAPVIAGFERAAAFQL
ncbi:protein-L-isoaspartate O-methyltransferase [Nereida sp. MMG025]|uniref:protein-L-isoaspartate O-methyltransferase family protein n=1 Tax=Nereida sp. MMG025 TaxID=2909981 RepID=UPI001F16CB89|nr:protein-L-isoaspartate O-methyltransferase [Nereida sp. MMG025]MCF6445066.1 protein-L-isoaspartate O-methyltransferase [Nereida sp. MMG025]